MTSVQFYHLTATPLERALPKLLEKAIASGFRAVLTAHDEQRLEQLNQLLWSYDPGSFMPHGTREDNQASAQPVYLSVGTDNPNGAKLLVVTDGKIPENALEYERIIDIFDGGDEAAVVAARTRWARYKEQFFSISYMRQTETGGWDKKTVA